MNGMGTWTIDVLENKKYSSRWAVLPVAHAPRSPAVEKGRIRDVHENMLYRSRPGVLPVAPAWALPTPAPQPPPLRGRVALTHLVAPR